MLRSRLALWLSIVIFPPLGLVLLWIRRGPGVMLRIAGSIGICLVAIVELFYVYGMHVEWNGNVSPYAVSFESRRRHDARVEESRKQSTTAAAAQIPEKARPSYWTDFRG